MKTFTFSAPWCPGVKLITLAALGILGFYLFEGLQGLSGLGWNDFLLRATISLALLGLGLALMVTRYAVSAEGIVIQRLLWRGQIDRADIVAVTMPSVVSTRALGLCGLWGFCGASGLAYSGTLGLHLVAASAYANRVVITRRRGLPVVISPASAEAFVRAYLEASPQ